MGCGVAIPHWASIQPKGGVIEPGEKDTVYVEIDRSGLYPGTYEDTLIFNFLPHKTHFLPIRLFIDFQPKEGRWDIIESNTTDDLLGVQFVSNNMGWAYSTKTLLGSTDGGISWSGVSAPIEANHVRDMQFMDENLGWLLRSDSFILLTDDGGESWDSLRCPAVGFHSSFHFVDEHTGWLAGYDGVYNIHDGGLTWKKQLGFDYGGTIQSSSLSFIDDQQGWLAYWTHVDDGTSGGPSFEIAFLYKTNDGGDTWINLFPGFFSIGGYAENVQFFNSGDGVLLLNGWLNHTIDGGATWIASELGGIAQFFLNKNYGWTSSGSAIKVTTDGGETSAAFAESATEKYKGVKGLYFYDKYHGWAVGNAGKILKYYPVK